MNRRKCPQCGLVNAVLDETCRRCASDLRASAELEPDSQIEQSKSRSIFKRLAWIAGSTLAMLIIWYLSMLVTSEDLGFERRQRVALAIVVLEQKGFAKQAFVLNHLVKYRATDSWWNRSVGHHDAYAATNFPFQIMTLYPEFFDVAVDDTERAAILLHESYHLFGSGEAAALAGAWQDKQRLGWTARKYSETKVWHNTKELTAATAPWLFSCGADGQSDCLQP